MPSTASINAAQKAGTHPYTMKPGTIFAASRIIAALTKSRKTPKVTNGEGKRDDLNKETQCRIENADHERRHQGRPHIIHIKSRNKIRRDHQCDGAE